MTAGAYVHGLVLPPESYDSIEHHVALAPDFGKACVPMGMLLAWCANMQLLSGSIMQAHEQLILRLRFEEANGSELLVACGGELRRDMFNTQGQQFLDVFYPRYMTFFADLFGVEPYSVRENWDNYQRLAQALVRELWGAPARHKANDGWLKRLQHRFFGSKRRVSKDKS